MLHQETKCNIKDIDRLLPYCWKQGKAVSIAATGTTGGLAILWNPNTNIMENFITTKWSITTTCRLIGSNKPGHLSNVYGLASTRDKKAFLINLEYLSTLTKDNIRIVGGDFNLIHNLDEEKGGTRHLEQESSKFQNLIDNIDLINLETPNGTFTWTNGRSGIHQIAYRLHRFLVSDSLMLEGTTLEASILDFHGSYHWPI
jgi:Rad3-related DNA helicase